MSKNLLQDIKIKHKTARPDRALGTQITSKALSESASNFTRTKPENFQPEIKKVKNPTRRSRYILWFVAIISLLFFFFSISYLFFKVVVTVNPKVKDLVLNENLSASKDSNVNGLSFQLISISGEETKAVFGEQKDVSETAKGIVVVYNAFGSAPQMLSIDTRLQGSNGKIYKTVKKIIVPGMKGNIPGSVEVGIYGSSAGEEYNSAPLDFKVFGFEGTSKYSKIYARSKGEITGGLKGKFSQISDAEKETAVNNLKESLQAKLFSKATGQIPGDFVLFKDAAFLNVDEETVNPASTGNQVSVSIKGTLYGLFFSEKDLTDKIIASNIDGYDGSPVYLQNVRNLTFTLSNKDNISFADVKNIDFNLSGAAKIVWKVDESKLTLDLLGKSKKDFNQILLQYANIDSADLVISPFWKMSLPDKSKDIKVIVNYPK